MCVNLNEYELLAWPSVVGRYNCVKVLRNDCEGWPHSVESEACSRLSTRSVDRESRISIRKTLLYSNGDYDSAR